MSHRKHEDVNKGNESTEENSKDKPPARKTGKRTRGHTDDHGNGRLPEKKVRREAAGDETLKAESKKSKLPTKKVSKRSRSSTSDNRRSRERKAQEGGSDEESNKKTIKSPTRKQSRRSRSSTSDDGRLEKKGESNESPMEKKLSGKKRQHSNSDGQEDEKLPKKKSNVQHVQAPEGAGKKRRHSNSDGQEDEKLPKKKSNVQHVHIPEGASKKSKDDKSQPVVGGKVKLIPGMLGKKRIWSESDDRDEGVGEAGKKSHASASGRNDKTPEPLSTPVEKKVPNTKVSGKGTHSNCDEKGNQRPLEKRTAHEAVHSSRDDQTPERFSTPVESTGNKVKPPLKMGKTSRSSTESQSQEDGRPPPEKRAKLAPGMTKTVLASNRRRDSKPNETVSKGTENGSRSGNKKRAKSPEIFAHNLKVLRKKSAMRRKKLTKEVRVVKTTC